MKRMIRALVIAAALTAAMTCSVLAVSGDHTTGSVDYNETEGTYSASYSGAVAGGQYVLLVVKGTEDNAPITQENILYIDQAAADASGKVSFSGFIPKDITDAVVLLGGQFANQSSPVVLGAIKSLEPEYTLGDVNGDDEVDGIDLVMIMQNMAGLGEEFNNTQKSSADVNKDGEVDGIDLVMIMRSMAGLESLD